MRPRFLEGLSQLLKNIQMIQKHLNLLRISTILLTMYDARTNLAFQVAEEAREHFPEKPQEDSRPGSSLKLPVISRLSSPTILLSIWRSCLLRRHRALVPIRII